MNRESLKLTLVTNKQTTSLEQYLEFVSLCIEGGVSCVQLREKSMSTQELLDFGASLKRLLDLNNIPLIINDHIDVCKQLDASGVHLGQSDGNIAEARKLLGSDKIIGISANSLTQLEKANILPVDYIGIGAIFHTNNKSNVERIWGIEGLKEARSISTHPIIAIGGIDLSNVNEVIRTGVHGIAAIGVFHDAMNPKETSTALIKIINKEEQ